MILVKKLKFFHVLCLSKIDREKVFPELLHEKKAFLDNVNVDFKRRQNWHFCKADSPCFFLIKLKFFHPLCLSKVDREKLFAEVLEKKQAFKDYKNRCLRKTQN